MTKYIITLQFNTEVESGDKDINDIERMVTSSWSNYCGSKVKIIGRNIIN